MIFPHPSEDSESSPLVTTGESRDGNGCGDHDTPYQFSNPKAYLNIREQIGLLIMRGYVMDYRSGWLYECAANGDIGYIPEESDISVLSTANKT